MPSDTTEDAIQKDFRELFNSERGKRVLRWIMYRNNVFITTHVSGNPTSSAFEEGRRAAVLEILTMVKDDIDPERFMADANTAIIESRIEQMRHDPLKDI